ncbi:lipopolysaccharide biosynthesis protein [Ochrobactrum quorumnocens]|uniref:Lipopolysaccharide biosynthesis protein n=1 Tax=Ochrobactrum quorumnocens TaxID=271865 RepID=A0A5N1K2T6_9HYPH|nr:lipopolysaccharide biosynthesis protein [[Ochrobactrum] quorumnocens]KAA9368564.1 lipopolysaccharide biosynthesis protein [[Ochrobactrum] quorumnocens]MBD7989818.1 lipopolysaccharide biosynthesis protein [Ochrobactrum gallinarum]
MIAKAFKKLSGSRGAVVRDYFSLFSGSAGRLVVSLLYFIALANTLPTGDFGIFATASGTGVVLSRLVSLGFSSPLYRISTVKPLLLGTYTAGYLAAVLVSLPLFAICSWLVYFVFFSRDISFLPFAIVVIAEALLWRSTEMIIIVNNGLRRFGISALLVIFGTVTRAVAAVLFMFLAATHDVAHWAWWYLAANTAALIVALRFYPRVKLRFEPRLYARRISDSIAVMGAELLFYIQSELDKLLVLSIGGPTTAGIYAIIMRLVDLTALPIRSFNMMLVQKLMRTPDMLASLRIRAGLEFAVFAISVAGLGAMVIFLQFFPKALGASVAPIVGLLPLVLLVPGFRNLIEYQTEILYARGQSGLRTLNMVLMTAAKALFVWLLLIYYGNSNDWIAGLNFVFAGIYILSLVFTYTSIKRPAKRV